MRLVAIRADFGGGKRGNVNRSLRIDFISDVSCPWCAVGLHALEAAIARLDDDVMAEIHFQPFELNPQMPPEGQDTGEHLMAKYGLTAEQLRQNTEAMEARGLAVGFVFGKGKRSRIYNTFDAHRLLHWAGLEGKQQALKHALFQAYFTDGRDPSSHEVLISVAEHVGLDKSRVLEILSGDEYAAEVRKQERYYLDMGVNAVPTVIFNEREMLRGAQSAEVYAQVLADVAGKQAEVDAKSNAKYS